MYDTVKPWDRSMEARYKRPMGLAQKS